MCENDRVKAKIQEGSHAEALLWRNKNERK
nr:MAG TPA: hypothetical protein [Caudoviricetes sp.]